MTEAKTISFGDNVRVLETRATREAGLAGLTGSIYGETTPSVTSVEVIGELKGDYAVNVYFEERQEDFWLTPELLEFLDHAPGTEITLQGVDKKWVRTEKGTWQETPGGVTHKSFWERITGAIFKKQE